MKISLLVYFVIFFSLDLYARPEYALKHGINSCTACHASPTGGGIRNVNGKLYGLRAPNGKHGPFSQEDRFQFDFRGIFFQPKDKSTSSRNGLGLMTTILATNLKAYGDEKQNLRLIAANNFGNFDEGLREAYLRFKTGNNFVSHIVFGRFNAPFGLLTDEHRTYARIQSNTILNTFNMGALISGKPIDMIHYDLALTNGFENPGEQGGNFSTGNTSGSFFNLRLHPHFLPFFIGASASYHDRPKSDDPRAYSYYAGLSFDRLTNGYFKGSLLIENSFAQFWNDNTINPDFGKRIINTSTDSAFFNAIKDKESESWYAQLSIDLRHDLILMYKYDYLALNKDFSSDAFERHGIGFRYFPYGSLSLTARYDKAEVGRDDLSKSTISALDAYWLLVHMWL